MFSLVHCQCAFKKKKKGGEGGKRNMTEAVFHIMFLGTVKLNDGQNLEIITSIAQKTNLTIIRK